MGLEHGTHESESKHVFTVLVGNTEGQNQFENQGVIEG
jgi:hypothetical protein